MATVLVDALFLLLLVMIILPHRPDPPAKPVVDLYSPLLIGIRWPDNFETDVDLWVRGPGDSPIGYTRLRGAYGSLVRDDVGSSRYNSAERYEIVSFVKMQDGEYIVNVHLYADHGGNAPIPVDVLIWRRGPDSYEEIWKGQVTLEAKKQEITVIRFIVRDGEVMPSSFHTTPFRITG